jgi:hypothetical protein
MSILIFKTMRILVIISLVAGSMQAALMLVQHLNGGSPRPEHVR